MFVRSFLNLLQAEQSQISQPLLIQQLLCLFIMAFCWTDSSKSVSLVPRRTELDPTLQMSHQIWAERITSLELLATLFLAQPVRPLTFSLVWLTVSLLFRVTPNTSSKRVCTLASSFKRGHTQMVEASSAPHPHCALLRRRELAGGPAWIGVQDWLSSRERSHAF